MKQVAVLLVALGFAGPLGAVSPDDWRPWFEALGEDSGPAMHRFGVVPLASEFGYSSRPVAGWADGAAWQGVGFNGRVTAGFSWASEFFDLSFAPVVWFAENRRIDLPASMNPPYGDAHRGAWDHPLRMGTAQVTDWAGGQTSVSAQYGPARVTVGTENRLWGQSRYNSLLLSANGPGVPSVEVALDRVITDWGTFEGHYLAGTLEPSGWQAESSFSGRRFWTGLFLSYALPQYPYLTLSAARVAQTSLDHWMAEDLLVPFVFKTRWGIDRYDQRVSLSYQWRFPEQALELYGEWGRNDYSPKLLLWLQNLERTQAAVVGFRKAFPSSAGLWAVEGELVSAFLGPEAFINNNGYVPNAADFYVHGIYREGYTVAGQDLGAAVGNGNALSLAGVWLGQDAGIKLELRRWVKDYSVLLATLDREGERRINVQLEGDLEGRWTSGAWTMTLGLTAVHEISPFFLPVDQSVSSFRLSCGMEVALP